MKKSYTFDDVALVPQFNNIPSRTEPSLSSWLTRNLKIDIPLIAAPMDSVIGDRVADALLEYGSVPIYHRFTDFSEQLAWVKRYQGQTFISCGIHHLEKTRELLDAGAIGVCIDVAHGHSDRMFQMVEQIKTIHPDKQVIAGNVCTAMAYQDLVNAGADAVKVGIGPGAACTTRMVTGFGVPQFTAIRDCAKVAEKLRVPLIADGGIRGSREVVLALAAGASSVMMGKLFALCEDSPAPKRTESGQRESKYRGQASEDFQMDFFGGLKEKTVAEGVDFWAPVTGTVRQLLEELLGGLRSGLTYGGARNIKELQRKAEFTQVFGSYFTESRPRPDAGAHKGVATSAIASGVSSN